MEIVHLETNQPFDWLIDTSTDGWRKRGKKSKQTHFKQNGFIDWNAILISKIATFRKGNKINTQKNGKHQQQNEQFSVEFRQSTLNDVDACCCYAVLMLFFFLFAFDRCVTIDRLTFSFVMLI